MVFKRKWKKKDLRSTVSGNSSYILAALSNGNITLLSAPTKTIVIAFWVFWTSRNMLCDSKASKLKVHEFHTSCILSGEKFPDLFVTIWHPRRPLSKAVNISNQYNNKKPSSMNFTRLVICYDSIQQGIAIWQGIILLQFGILHGVLLPSGIWQGRGRQKLAGFRRAQNNPSELS